MARALPVERRHRRHLERLRSRHVERHLPRRCRRSRRDQSLLGGRGRRAREPEQLTVPLAEGRAGTPGHLLGCSAGYVSSPNRFRPIFVFRSGLAGNSARRPVNFAQPRKGNVLFAGAVDLCWQIFAKRVTNVFGSSVRSFTRRRPRVAQMPERLQPALWWTACSAFPFGARQLEGRLVLVPYCPCPAP